MGTTEIKTNICEEQTQASSKFLRLANFTLNFYNTADIIYWSKIFPLIGAYWQSKPIFFLLHCSEIKVYKESHL